MLMQDVHSRGIAPRGTSQIDIYPFFNMYPHFSAGFQRNHHINEIDGDDDVPELETADDDDVRVSSFKAPMTARHPRHDFESKQNRNEKKKSRKAMQKLVCALSCVLACHCQEEEQERSLSTTSPMSSRAPPRTLFFGTREDSSHPSRLLPQFQQQAASMTSQPAAGARLQEVDKVPPKTVDDGVQGY
jgi:hypothetical protein